ncbi:hypothetical protein [Aeoliella sp. SH292]
MSWEEATISSPVWSTPAVLRGVVLVLPEIKTLLVEGRSGDL